MMDAGYRTIETLRLEKRYLYWGADITPDYTPYEAGLGFAVAMNKGDFIGRDALVRGKAEGPKRRLVTLLLDEPVSVYGGEAIFSSDGRVLGVTSSGGYGHTIAKSIVYGYVAAEDAKGGRYEVEAFMRRVGATRTDKAPYDPERKKLLA